MLFISGTMFCQEQIILEGLNVKSISKRNSDIVIIFRDAPNNNPDKPVDPAVETSKIQKIYDGDNGSQSDKKANLKKLTDIYTLIAIKAQDSSLKNLSDINAVGANEAKSMNESMKATRKYIEDKMTALFPDDVAMNDELRMKLKSAAESIIKELRGVK
jgi:hypothetical protein